MNAHALSLNPMEASDAWTLQSAALREAVICRIPVLIAGDKDGDQFHEARQWVVDSLLDIHRDGDAIDFSRLLDRDGIARLCEMQPEWVDLSPDDQAIVAAELHAELRRYRAARPIPTSLATVIPPRAPGFLTDVKGE